MDTEAYSRAGPSLSTNDIRCRRGDGTEKFRGKRDEPPGTDKVSYGARRARRGGAAGSTSGLLSWSDGSPERHGRVPVNPSCVGVRVEDHRPPVHLWDGLGVWRQGQGEVRRGVRGRGGWWRRRRSF